MKMKNLFAGLVATTIVASSASAFAAPIANDAGYDKEAGTYSIVSDLSTYGADQMTILIIPEAAYLAGTINDADILYIDQAAADTANIFKSVGILGGTELADGTYYAKIGGENIAEDGIIVEKFTITTTSEGVELQLGNVNFDDEINGFDLTAVVNHITGFEVLVKDSKEYFVANVNGDDEINGFDLTAIVNDITGFEKLGTAVFVEK